MSEENRKIAFELLGYQREQTVAGMLASDLKKLHATESALDEAERRGAEKMRERAATIPENHYWDSLTGQKHGESLATMIRALPLEGPKDGRE